MAKSSQQTVDTVKEFIKNYRAMSTALAAKKRQEEADYNAQIKDLNSAWTEPLGPSGYDMARNYLVRNPQEALKASQTLTKMAQGNGALAGVLSQATGVNVYKGNKKNDGVTNTKAYEKVSGDTAPTASATEAKTTENPNDYVEYTYKPGDTFGQVILDLGIDTNKGLWGSDGDVAYYTKQLREQGIPGMVPIGTKIRLKKRK